MKLTRVLSSTAALVTLLTIGRNASAQDAPPEAAPPPPPPVVSTQPAPQPTAVVVVGAPGQPPPGYYPPGYAEPPRYRDHARFRFGIEAGIGYMFASSSLGSARGVSINLGALRLGAQINNDWAVYLQSNLPLGIAGGVARDGTELGGLAFAWNNSVVAEYTLGDILHLGLGPSFDSLFGLICPLNTNTGNGSESTNKSSCLGASGGAFGMTGRIAATLGSVRPGRRSGFSLGIDLHPTFTAAGTFFFSTLNFGYEAY